MRPVDKFGKPIFDHVYRKLLMIGSTLGTLGYRESRTKPNLFYRNAKSVMFFADMRGTDEVPIWQDQKALFWMQVLDEAGDTPWAARVFLIEWARLASVPKRLSFEGTSWDEYVSRSGGVAIPK